MNNQLEINPRKQLRQPGYNYRSEGYYFITMCINNRQCLFGDICEDQMILNAAGKMISHTFQSIQNEYLGWFLDTQIVMPNHIHAILCLYKHAINQPTPLSLPELIRNIKSLTTVNYSRGVYLQNWQAFNKRLWQRSYYEHVIRNEHSLNNIRNYIKQNPAKWHQDNYNPRL